MLLVPSTAFAGDWSIGTGYMHRQYDQKDQLGATSPYTYLKLSQGDGPRVYGKTDFGLFGPIRLGLTLEAAYLFLHGQPRQEGYAAKGKGIDTSSLASPTASAKLTVRAKLPYIDLYAKGGVGFQAVSPRWGVPFDYDAIGQASLGVGFPWEGWRVVVLADLFVAPTVVAKNDLGVSYGLTVAFDRVLKSDSVPAPAPVALPDPVSAPVALPVPVSAEVPPVVVPINAKAVEPPRAVTPVEVPQAATKTVEDKPRPPPKAGDLDPEDPIILFIVSTLKENQGLAVQIIVYANDGEMAKRRAFQAREHIIGNGIETTRVLTKKKKVAQAGKKDRRSIEFQFLSKP
jgi:hypothetical protein